MTSAEDLEGPTRSEWREEQMRSAVALLERLRRGEKSARAELVQRVLPVLKARVYRARRRSPELQRVEPADLVHDIWLVLLADDARQLHRWSPDRGATLEGFVGMIAERELSNLVDKARTQKRAARVVSMDEAQNALRSVSEPEIDTITRDLAIRLRAHLDGELPTRGQAIFVSLFSDGRSPDEVARALGVQKQVVYNWQHRIRKLARRFLAGASES